MECRWGMEKVLPGRWRVEVPVPEKGIYSGQIVLEKDGTPVDKRFFTVTRGFSREYLLEEPDEEGLRALETGGTWNPDPAQRFSARKTVRLPWSMKCGPGGVVPFCGGCRGATLARLTGERGEDMNGSAACGCFSL